MVAAAGSQCTHGQLAVVGLGFYSGGHGELLRLYEQQVTDRGDIVGLGMEEGFKGQGGSWEEGNHFGSS